jgi:hypothetical protein
MRTSSSRVRVYDAQEVAKNIRETFTAKKSIEATRFPFHWPKIMQHVGESHAVAYSSDKWKNNGEYELYKHLADSYNRALCVPGFLRDFDNPSKSLKTIGPMVSFADVPMPKHFAVLALFEEIDLQLHVGGTNEHPELGHGDDGIVQVSIGHAVLGGSKILWSEVDNRPDQPFLFIYTERDGPLMIVVGEELDIEADGIVG